MQTYDSFRSIEIYDVLVFVCLSLLLVLHAIDKQDRKCLNFTQIRTQIKRKSPPIPDTRPLQQQCLCLVIRVCNLPCKLTQLIGLNDVLKDGFQIISLYLCVRKKHSRITLQSSIQGLLITFNLLYPAGSCNSD